MFAHVKQTYHSAPSVPWIESVVCFDNLNDIKLIIVMSNVCLIEHAVIVFMHLMETTQEHFSTFNFLHAKFNEWFQRSLSFYIAYFRTSPQLDNEQCSSTFLVPFTCGTAARRASFVEVKASLGLGVSSCFAFLPPALAAAAARLFGGMILTGRENYCFFVFCFFNLGIMPGQAQTCLVN